MKKSILAWVAFIVATLGMAQNVRNASFEKGLDDWECVGLKLQTNSEFPLKSGNTYVEKWTGSGGKVGDAELKQQLTQLPAGVYVLSVAAQNIQQNNLDAKQTGAWIYAGEKQTAVENRDRYTVRFVCVRGEVEIGFKAVGASGNWLALDDFQVKQATDGDDELRQAFLALIEETEGLTQEKMAPEALALLQEKIVQARSVYDSATTPDIDAACRSLVQAQKDAQEAIFQYKKEHASLTDPLEITHLLVNPSFENNFTGWTQQEMSLQSNDAFTLKDGQTYAEKWVSEGNKVGDALLRQTLTGLDAGTYIVECAGQNYQENATGTAQKGAYLFGDQTQTPIQNRREYSLTFTHIDGEMTIGFEAEGATGNWLAVDNFRLYYAGCDVELLKEELNARISHGEELLKERMQKACRQSLEGALTEARAFDFTQKDMKSLLPRLTDTLMSAINEAEASIEANLDLQEAIAQAEKEYDKGEGKEAETFRQAIDEATAISEALDSETRTLYDQVTLLARATFVYQLANPSGPVPKVKTDPRYVHGCQEVFGRMSVSGVSASNLIEQGFVYSQTHPEPTVLDERSQDYLEHNGQIFRMPMKSGTLYYIRAYAMTKGHAVGYGDVIRVSTLPQGKVTWTFDYGSDDPAQNNRIETAVKDATGWWSNYTSIRGFNLDAHWSPGTPTADCGYGGYMRIGTNMGQRCGTVLHEMNHGVGTGTLGIWGGWENSPLRVTMNGDWAGDRANGAIQFWENDNSVVVTGAYDNAHWGIHHVGQAYEEGGGSTALWMNKYAINGAHLEPGAWAGPTNWNDTQILFIGNSIITQGFMEDGLIPVGAGSGGQCLPTYTFEHRDDAKYYLTSESEEHGRTKTFLTETDKGTLKWLPNNADTDEDGDGMNDAAGWYITFDAQTQLYQFQNAQTGHYLSNSTGASMKAMSRNKLTNSEQFTLMRRRSVNAGTDPYRGYWITNYTSRNALQANANGVIGGSEQNLWDEAQSQRWLIVPAQEAADMSAGAQQEATNLLAELVRNLKVIAEHPYVENVDTLDSHVALEDALIQAENVLVANANAQVLADTYTATRKAGMNYLSAVTPLETPFDLTFLITNPTMEKNAEGWTEEPNNKYGCTEFQETVFDCNQTLSAMPKGYMVLTVQGFQRPGVLKETYADFLNGKSVVKASLYLNTKTTKLAHIGQDAQEERLGATESAVGDPTRYVPGSLKAASLYFDKGLYQNTLIHYQTLKNKDIKIGVKCTQTGEKHWTVFRNFHLYFYGMDNPTPVNEIWADESGTRQGETYDLSGRRVEGRSLQHGVYIHNGRKVVK